MKGTTGRGYKVYGSGLLTSHGEIAHAVDSPSVQRYPFQLEWVVNQSFEIDHYQPLLFVLESFEHLFELVGELEAWMRAGQVGQRGAGRTGDERGRREEFPRCFGGRSIADGYGDRCRTESGAPRTVLDGGD